MSSIISPKNINEIRRRHPSGPYFFNHIRANELIKEIVHLDQLSNAYDLFKKLLKIVHKIHTNVLIDLDTKQNLIWYDYPRVLAELRQIDDRLRLLRFFYPEY